MIAAWIRAAREGRGPLRHARAIRRSLREARAPWPRALVRVMASAMAATAAFMAYLLNVLVRKPLLASYCQHMGRRLHLEGAIPMIIGDGEIRIGDDVTIGAPSTWDLASPVLERPVLSIGNRTQINYRSILSVAQRIEIGDDCMIAGEVAIFDNSSHPVDPLKRHSPITASEVAPVVIGNNVWVGMRSIILRGVTIGDNSVVAAGSVVTRPVPANVVVAGNPARVVKALSAAPRELPGTGASE